MSETVIGTECEETAIGTECEETVIGTECEEIECQILLLELNKLMERSVIGTGCLKLLLELNGKNGH
ncbi:hypothetical protein CHUAL_002618 [Chamberlinius hualienensis]